MYELIKGQIETSIKLRQEILHNDSFMHCIQSMVDEIVLAYRKGHIVLLCGNGGSAGDAQHIAAEFVGRFHFERRALPAIALSTNSSIVTAIGNDYDFSKIYERQVEAYGHPGDVLIGLSTSGNSKNVFRALEKAHEMKIKTLAILGGQGGICKDISDLAVVVSSNEPSRIQEIHIMIGHIICDMVEHELFQQ